MSLVVKICGLNSTGALDAAVGAGADMVGFVFFPASPRHVSFDMARTLGQQVRGRAIKVALTVDADDAMLDAIVDALHPDLLQLHGKEPPARVAALRRRHGVPLMKAIAVEARGDLAAMAAYADLADRFLFDAHAPRDATRPGGLGKSFDWQLLDNIETSLPFILSGGLDAGNVGEALRMTRAHGVDVSSGVERVPGEKDPDKIRAFVRAAREAARLATGAVTSPA